MRSDQVEEERRVADPCLLLSVLDIFPWSLHQLPLSSTTETPMLSLRSRPLLERRVFLTLSTLSLSKERLIFVSVSLLPFPVLATYSTTPDADMYPLGLSSSLFSDAMGSNGGKVVTTLPVSDETSSRRSDVSVEFTLVYTELGYPVSFCSLPSFTPSSSKNSPLTRSTRLPLPPSQLTFAKVLNFPAIPADNAGAYEWVSKELPSLLAGWETSKNGSPLYKAQKLRVCEGGLDRECFFLSLFTLRFLRGVI